MGSISKAIKRVVPKEIQPILPIAASMFGGPLIGAKLSGIAALANKPVITQALASGLTSAGVDFLTGGKVDPKTLVTSTLLGGGGQFFKDVGTGAKGIMGIDLSDKAREEFAKLGNLIAPTGVDETGKFDISGDIVKSGATAATAGGSIAAYNAAEQAQKDYDEMMAGREADAAADRQARIDFITQNMQQSGFSQEEIDDALRNAGFKKGGRVGFKEGGGDFDFRQALSDMFDAIREAQATQAGVLRDEEEKEKEIEEAIRQLDLFRDEKAKGGVMATRVGFEEGGSSSIEQQKRENYFDLKRDDFMSMSEYLESGLSDTDLRSSAAEGGIMNLKVKGMPAEMDLRRGGFVPIGAKEKADDVPARLSKNEFVMTADAVRAAGGGSVNKGAKKMYDLMNKLEARV